MDKLEMYLDQVCRGIAGPRSLRQHIRQELREHLLDAAAKHRAAGLAQEQALERALADFGGPEQVRSELEAMHGHRLMSLMIDKAMQWKERTMKAKWVWSTWAHLALLGVIAGQVMFIAAAMIVILPKHHWFWKEGLFDSPHPETRSLVKWAFSFLNDVAGITQHGLWVALGVAAAWGLFEWRVRSENKMLIRLSALGTVALGLMVVASLTSAALVLPMAVTLPNVSGGVPGQLVGEQAVILEKSVGALERAVEAKDWPTVEEHAWRGSQAASALARATPVAWRQPEAGMDERRAALESISRILERVKREAEQEDRAGNIAIYMRNFGPAYSKWSATTTRPAR